MAEVGGGSGADVDTIVAQATAEGVGAIAVVRLTGPEATAILERLSPPGAGLPEPRAATLTELVEPGDGTVIDRALVTRFQAPASYTGEDMVEISCHGGWLTPRLVVEACLRAGARAAEPGEFTKRAYLRGKLDMVQSEAVADLIEARSTAMRDAALGQLERGLSRRISALRERLVQVEALLAHHVDFPEEDDAPVPLDDIVAEAWALKSDLERMLATAPEGELLREGALAVFAGAPNVGKSSLYNALVGEERAIVTAEAGTTRDALEAPVQLGGYPFRLVDTAGLREEAAHVERLGIEVARSYLARADVILLCVDGRDRGSPLRAVLDFLGRDGEAPVVLVETKADLRRSEAELPRGEAERPRWGPAEAVGGDLPVTPEGSHRVADAETGPGVVGRVRVSVETGEGLDELRGLLPELVYSATITSGSENPVLLRKRHARAVKTARDEVGAFMEALEAGVPAEMAASHLQEAGTALEELLGVISVDDVLDVVFRDFCIGK